MGDSATGGRAVKARELETQAIALRKAGMRYEGIARELGCALSTAHAAVKRVLQRWAEQNNAAAAELVALEDARLDVVMVAIAKEVQAGNLAAIDRWLRVIELRCRLHGLFPAAPLAGTVTVTMASAWVEVRTAVLEALAPYPEVRAEVASRLVESAAVVGEVAGDDEDEGLLPVGEVEGEP